jgi:hypothetical protein
MQQQIIPINFQNIRDERKAINENKTTLYKPSTIEIEKYKYFMLMIVNEFMMNIFFAIEFFVMIYIFLLITYAK